jgi:hypothetical protein
MLAVGAAADVPPELRKPTIGGDTLPANSKKNEG